MALHRLGTPVLVVRCDGQKTNIYEIEAWSGSRVHYGIL